MFKKRRLVISGVVALFGITVSLIAFFAEKPQPRVDLVVRCRIDASQAFPLEFYFTQDEETAFRERIIKRVPKGVSSVVAKIPVERLRKLRVDFGSAPRLAPTCPTRRYCWGVEF